MTKKVKILVIDDLNDIHDAIKEALEKIISEQSELDPFAEEDKTIDKESELTFIIDSTYQGEEGFNQLLSEKNKGVDYDLVICDMRMPPGWDGLKTMVKISEIDPGEKFILCTAYSDHTLDEIHKKVKTTDKVVLLEKPFSKADLKECVESIIKKFS